MTTDRFTDNSAGTRMALDVESFLAAGGVLDRPEAEQRAWVLDQYARGEVGWIAARELEHAGWLPEGSADAKAREIEGGDAHVAGD